MSWRATTYIEGLSAGVHGESMTRTEKFVLLLLGNRYNDDEGCARPSVARLAREALLSERQARYCLRTLEEKGLIETSHGTGRRHTNKYSFPGLAAEKGAMAAPFIESQRGQPREERGQSGAGKGAIAIAPEPQRTTEEPQTPLFQRTERAGARRKHAHLAAGIFQAAKDYALESWRTRFGSSPSWGAKDFVLLAKRLHQHPDMTLAEFSGRWDCFLADPDSFNRKMGYALGFFSSRFDAYVPSAEGLDLPMIEGPE